MTINIDELLPHCLGIVREAGELVRANWNSAHQIRHKGAIDLVTETDLAVQKFLHARLGSLLPAAAFMGEENEGQELAPDRDSGLCWVVDPVDGTTNFVHRIPFVGVSVALCQAGRPLLGIVDAPMLGEFFHAAIGQGTYLNGQPVRVSSAASLEETLVATGFPYDCSVDFAGLMRRFANVLPVTQGMRRLGAASLDLAYVACGRLDAFYEAGLKPWDMAAGWLLVTEAGGNLSDYSGAMVRFGSTLLATNGHVHEAMLALLGDAR